MQIKPNERIAIFGHTGCGKTTFARRFLLPHYRRFVALDPKQTFRMAGVPISQERYDPKKDRQIVRISAHGPGSYPIWGSIINDIWRRGDCCIYVDETVLITRSDPILPELASAIQTGRERGIGLIMLTQSPIRAPRQMLEQSEHFVIFHLPYIRSRKKVIEFSSDNVGKMMQERWYSVEKESGNTRYDAIYYNVDADKAVYIRQTPKE